MGPGFMRVTGMGLGPHAKNGDRGIKVVANQLENGMGQEKTRCGRTKAIRHFFAIR